MLRSRSKDKTPVEDTTAPDVYPVESENALEAHALHHADTTCARCNRPLTENDEARRRASGDYVHLCC